MIIFRSEKTKKLNKKLILSICKLKDTHWKNGLNSQLKHYKKISRDDDLNNLMFFDKKLIGYTLLRKRKFRIKKDKNNYLHFDTLIIDKNHRRSEKSKLLMNFNNLIIKKNNRPSFLTCKKKLVNFYKRFDWKVEKKKRFKTKILLKNKFVMSFNLNRRLRSGIELEI